VRSYFDGAERLRVSQRTYFFTDPSSTPRARTTFQEYFYDALGRRVALRSQRDSTCTDAGDPTPGYDCAQTMERFVWDGDQLLVELRDYGKWGDAAATLNTGGSGASGAFYGSVGYTYALGLFGPDAPLTVQSGNLGGGGFVPQASWRGTYEDGTAADGSDFGGTTYNWPGQQTGLYLAPDARIATITATRWLGSLVEGKADASGLVYDRNRYYDPSAGRFTQEDPAGLAGGVNLYGYAGADPANNSDPFGLWPTWSDITRELYKIGVKIALVIKAGLPHTKPEAEDMNPEPPPIEQPAKGNKPDAPARDSTHTNTPGPSPSVRFGDPFQSIRDFFNTPVPTWLSPSGPKPFPGPLGVPPVLIPVPLVPPMTQ
jgi:RHS repeat-associated protein